MQTNKHFFIYIRHLMFKQRLKFRSVQNNIYIWMEIVFLVPIPVWQWMVLYMSCFGSEGWIDHVKLGGYSYCFFFLKIKLIEDYGES